MHKNNTATILFFIALFTTVSINPVFGQISINNLAEYQVGNLPDTAPGNLTTLYDNFDLLYRQDNITAAFKFERFQHADPEKNYSELSQKSIQLSLAPFDITLGNFYEIFGRGLLLRTFEIPGNILEDRIYRTRYGFYRDLDGVAVNYQSEKLEIKLLRGRPLFNLLPPTFENENRRPLLLEGMEIKLNLTDNFSVGHAYLRENSPTQTNEYGSINFSANLPNDLQLYSEYAQKYNGAEDLFSFADESSHAFYAGANALIGPLGLSFEAKDYRNFMLNFNDPPPIVKEHQYIVLNRSTHVVEPLYETGWQGEVLLTLKGNNQVVANFARSTNKLLNKDAVFQEFFVEGSFYFSEETSGKFFFDLSEDEFKFEKNRVAFGTNLSREWPHGWGTVLGLEYQQLTREIIEKQDVTNIAGTLEISRAPNFSAGLIWERSVDPDLTDIFSTPRIENDGQNWLATTFGYQINQNHFASLFYGKRRGGLACTSGICYEVLDFEGFEFRLSSNF
ncbi:MAG: hypothetical protein DWQ05_21305 [Calditrichaeota bacterium]|nr:MAG: hypothetical protein DWQ05_21305 [Calditrichota bacterium]